MQHSRDDGTRYTGWVVLHTTFGEHINSTTTLNAAMPYIWYHKVNGFGQHTLKTLKT